MEIEEVLKSNGDFVGDIQSLLDNLGPLKCRSKILGDPTKNTPRLFRTPKILPRLFRGPKLSSRVSEVLKIQDITI